MLRLQIFPLLKHNSMNITRETCLARYSLLMILLRARCCLNHVLDAHTTSAWCKAFVFYICHDVDVMFLHVTQVTYEIDADTCEDCPFDIDPDSGEIEANREFPQDSPPQYTLSVIASDGADSDIPGVTGPNTSTYSAYF